ncbi:agmatinase [Pelagibacteraceae bacterium]|nr:agmatinase [Pelagibacteraceae bacterium]
MTFLSSLSGFLGLPQKTKSKNYVCVVPFGLEKTVSYGSGTENGPKAILKASHQVELFDEELLQDSYKNFQIKTLKPFKIKKSLTDALNQLTSITKNILNKKEFPLILGGEHSITPGIIKAFSQKYKKITILQIDAHADLRDSYEGEKFSHASAMRRCLDFKNVEIVSFGIRNLCRDEYKYYKSISKRMKIFWGKDMGNWNLNTLKKTIKNKNVYITFDLDGFDSSLMSATGTPEPGGLFWNDAMRILKITSENSNIVGADINELAPKKNLHACDFIAAKLAYKILSYKFKK